MSSTLLLIEDSPTDAAILTAAFQSIGWRGQLQVAVNGPEALAWLDQATVSGSMVLPQLILLDLNLPGKTGHEVLHAIKSHPYWQQIPILVLSSSSNPSDIQESYRLHVNAYLAKPTNLENYQLIAQRILDFWLETAKLPMI
ncbi:MAG: response regulator [Cyanobacteria bacterium P01_F01_bin.86]